MVNQVREVSKSLLECPGFNVCVDEIMVRFTGRITETHRVKNKPISEGYKRFALCDSKSGYVCHFTPDGRQASNRGENEFVHGSQ